MESSAPTPGAPTSKISLKKVVVLLLITMGVVFTLALLGGGGYALYQYMKYASQQKVLNKKLMEREQEQKQLQQALAARVEDIHLHGTALPPCPLVYPLLNEKGKATPLGAFLSLYAMRQATYLPESVYQLPDLPIVFDDFGLFQNQVTPPSVYRSQLPYYFGSKQFGEGALKKTRKGYRIQLRFWGDRPAKKYKKDFKAKDLNKAPGWMAACLHNFAGFKPTKDQAAYRDQPVFGNGDDFVLAAAEEKLFRCSGTKLVLHWDRILAKNPENPFLAALKVSILTALDCNKYMDYLEPLVKKHSDSTYFKYVLSAEYNHKKKYDQALDIIFPELKRDDDNPMWYEEAKESLVDKGDWINAYQLLKNWTEKYPADPNAWIKLSIFMKDWAWDARGGDTVDKVPTAAWPIFQKRIAEGYGYGQKGTQIAPGFWKTWGICLVYGNGAELKKATVRDYFNKAHSLNPVSYRPYGIYLEYIKPKWFGSREEMMAFAEEYAKWDPYLMTNAVAENMMWDDSLKVGKTLSAERKKAYEDSPDWPVYQKYCELALKQCPYDLDTWYYYLYYAERVGEVERVNQYARKLAKGRPELEALPIMIGEEFSSAHYWNLETNQDKSKFWSGEEHNEVLRDESLQMQKLDPDNWYWANRAICYCMHTSQVDMAIKEYKLVGEEHWDPTVCEKSDWETVKGWAIATPTAVPGVSLPHR